jgi:hypothetical protein
VILRSRVRDCLFLNWALPEEALPQPPPSLRYQTHRDGGQDWVFASALLFRHEGLHLPSAPWPRLSYPQLNLRFYTLDEDDIPSVVFHRMWVPPWVVPVARWIGRQMAGAGSLSFPDSAVEADVASRWHARAAGELCLTTCASAPHLGVGPQLGSWEATVNFFRQRPRGYGRGPSGLRRVETSHVSTSILPVEVDLERTDLLSRTLLLDSSWPEIHSAWVCPELTFDFEILPEKEAALGRRLPAPG